ncbi:MAG: hypothetical protein V4858_07635 [Pseudomonadota bacterium]
MGVIEIDQKRVIIEGFAEISGKLSWRWRAKENDLKIFDKRVKMMS